MQKKHILLAKESLKLLEKKDLGRIKISSILKNHTNTGIKNKTQLLENINSFFDFLLKKNLSSLESSSQKDMLFEIIMARLDILNSYRKSLLKDSTPFTPAINLYFALEAALKIMKDEGLKEIYVNISILQEDKRL